MLLPWALFVQLNGGLIPYLQSSAAFSRAEGAATALPTLALRVSPEVWLFYLFRILPVACAFLAWRRLRGGLDRWPGEAVAVIAIAFMAALANSGFLRDTLKARLPDAIVPAVLLGAWLLSLAWSRHRPLTRLAWSALAAVVLAITVLSIAQVSEFREQMGRTGLLDGTRVVEERAADLGERLGREYPDGNMTPSRFAGALMRFALYVDRCTAPDDRLLASNLMPEVFVLAKRGFAGGQIAFLRNFYMTPEEQQQTINRMRRQRVAFVVIALDHHTEFQEYFLPVHAYISTRFEPFTDVAVETTKGVRILVERGRVPVGVDPTTGWPCFREDAATR